MGKENHEVGPYTRAVKRLESGEDPISVSSATGVSIAEIRMMKRLSVYAQSGLTFKLASRSQNGRQ